MTILQPQSSHPPYHTSKQPQSHLSHPFYTLLRSPNLILSPINSRGQCFATSAVLRHPAHTRQLLQRRGHSLFPSALVSERPSCLAGSFQPSAPSLLDLSAPIYNTYYGVKSKKALKNSRRDGEFLLNFVALAVLATPWRTCHMVAFPIFVDFFRVLSHSVVLIASSRLSYSLLLPLSLQPLSFSFSS